MVANVGLGGSNKGQATPADRLVRDGQASTDLTHEVVEFVPDVFIGGAQAAWNMVSGMASMVLHPIRTAKGLYFLASKLVTQPGPTLHLLGQAIIDPYIEACQSGHPGRAVGMGLVDIGSLFITPGEVVNVARGGAAFASAAVHGLSAGEDLGLALKEASVAGSYTMKATQAARDAERLAELGHAAESSQMAVYANDALGVAKLATTGSADAVAGAVAKIAPEATVNVAGTAMTYGNFLSYSRKLVGIRGLTLLTGRVPKGIYSVASDAQEASDATAVAEKILAGGTSRPSLLGQIGRQVVRNPQAFGLITPAIGLIPDTLGRIGALPRNLPSGKALTPATAAKIASQYNLTDTVANVQAFIDEVSGYQGTTIGPDTGSKQQIQELQALLKVAGYNVEVSGTWDTATSAAVIGFKRDHGIHQSYKIANGQYAVNEYADSNTVNQLLAKVNDPTLKQAASKTLQPASKA